jgi:predicted DNA-binding transcriptional regulator AlpA
MNNNTNQINKITKLKQGNINMKNENITPKYLRPKELAEYLGIGLSTVWLYSKQGKIKRIKMSQKVTLFNVEETEKALNLNESMN